MVVIATLNLQTSNNPSKLKNLSVSIIHNQIDIIALQEINTVELDSIPRDYAYYVNYNPGELCTAFIYKKSLNVKEGRKSPDGRIISLTLNDEIEIINIYGYPNGRGEELRNHLIFNELPKYFTTNRDIILLGDFNFVCRAEDRLKSGKIHTDFLDLTKGFKLTDLYLLKGQDDSPFATRFTFHNNKGSTRIDRIYWSGQKNKIQKFKYLDVVYSDHVMVITEVKSNDDHLETKEKSKAPWKLDVKLLKNDFFKKQIKNFINKSKLRAKEYKNILNWWDFDFKDGIKKIAIDFVIERKQHMAAHQQFIERVLEQIRAKIEKGEESSETYDKLKHNAAVNQINNLESAKARAKLKYPIKDEIANVAHMIADRKKRDATRIQQLQDTDGNIQTGQNEIKQTIEEFYGKLYTLEKRPGDFDPFIKNIKNKVNTEQFEKLKQPLTGGEIFTALNSLPEGRSPGIDGIPTEFYSEFWDDINQLMLELFNHILEVKSLAKSQKKGLITLLPKKGDLSLLENWRPVSVLCADYKILSKVLVNRIKPSLQSLINVDQTGALAGRTITDNLQYARNVVLKMENSDTSGAIVSLDFQKAFDRVDRDLIYKILQKLNFPSNIIEYIKILYEESVSIFKVNNQLTGKVPLNRGIKQGCPLAALLYIVYIEPFILTLQNHIKGIEIGSTQFKTSCYIDDIHMFVSDEYEISTIAVIIEKYHQCTNSQINLSKSQILGLGRWSHKNNCTVDWLKTVNIMEILGVLFTNSMTKTINLNSQVATHKTRMCLKTAKTQRLTIHQRVIFANTFVVSKITHTAKILPMPLKAIKKIQSMINKFVWTGRFEKLSLGQTINHKSKGGLGLVTIKEKIDSLLVANYIKTLTNTATTPNKLALTYWSSYDLRIMTNDQKGPRAESSHPFFRKVIKRTKALLKDKPSNFSSKCIYLESLKTVKEIPKIICKNPMRNYEIIFENMNNPILEPKGQEHMFFYTHNILTTKDRLHRCRVAVKKTCSYCTENETALHITECNASKSTMDWLIDKLTIIDPTVKDISITDLVTLNFRLTNLNKHFSCLWLISEFMTELWAVRQEHTLAAQIRRKALHKLFIKLKDFKLKKNYKTCINLSNIFSG
jgi:hypothetical protein